MNREGIEQNKKK